MKKFVKIFAPVGLVATILIVTAFVFQGKTDCYSGYGVVKIAYKTFKVELADTPHLREKGLSGHAPLAPNEGMLFTFGKETTPRFWMKDMLFPIHIIWLSEDFEVVGIQPYLTPETYPKTYSPNVKVKYALEVGINAYEDPTQIIGQRGMFSCQK